MQENQLVEVSFTVEEWFSGRRLDHYLARRLPRFSRTEVQELIRTRAHGEGGRRLRPSSPVRPGDRFVILYPERVEEERHYHIPVLWEDEHLMAVSKPPDLPVHPSAKVQKNTLINILRERQPDGEAKLTLCHRLDRETSGIVLLAKGGAVAGRIGVQFKGRGVTKEYMALVCGEVADDEGEINLPIGPSKSVVRLRQWVDLVEGKHAVTRFRVEERLPAFTLVRALPVTGRLHQIRVHFSAFGHPIVGDKIYGPDEACFLEFIERGFDKALQERLLMSRHALHAASLCFAHPVTGENVRVEAPLPDDMLQFINARKQARRPERRSA